MFSQSFDETIYRIIESDSISSKTGELKERIDREPEFRAAFHQTRDTMASLQGLRPKPSEQKTATFTQRDIDKLTRDILKGYRLKFAGVLSDLGYAYSLETPRSDFALVKPKNFPSKEEIKAQLQTGKTAYQSMASSDEISSELARLAQVQGELTLPAEQALACFSLSRNLKPNDSLTLAREASIWTRKGDCRWAEGLTSASLELARTSRELSFAASMHTVVLLVQDRFEDAQLVIESRLRVSPLDLGSLYNRVINRICLRDTALASKQFVETFALCASQHELSHRTFRSALASVEKGNPEWSHFKSDRYSFSQFLKGVETYFGSSTAILAEGVV